MSLFLRSDLCKGAAGAASSPTPPKTASNKTKPVKDQSARQTVGEQRGGKYVARVQVGYDKDGSPKYKYFKTQEEYKNWKEKNGKSSKKKKKTEKNPHNLAQKVDREHRESKEKQENAPRTAGSDPIKDNKTSIRKSLYVRL